MSAESISSVSTGGAPRALAAPSLPVAPAETEKASASLPTAKAPEIPKKAEIDYDPKQRQQELAEAVDRLNEQMRQNGRALEIGVDRSLDRAIYTVKNSQTGEVVRQIPNETLLRVAHHLEEVKGLFQDERI